MNSSEDETYGDTKIYLVGMFCNGKDETSLTARNPDKMVACLLALLQVMLLYFHRKLDAKQKHLLKLVHPVIAYNVRWSVSKEYDAGLTLLCLNRNT